MRRDTLRPESRDRGGNSYNSILIRAAALGYTVPSAAQQTAARTLITSLKTAGVWKKIDALYLFANDGSANYSTLNIRDPNKYQLSLVNSPTWTSGQGFTGNGTSAYLESGYNISTAGGLLTQDSAHIGVFTRSITVSSSRDLGTSASAQLALRLRTGTDSIQVNSASGTTASYSESAGHLMGVRRDSANAIPFVNGSALTAASQTSAALVNGTMRILMSSGGGFSDRQILSAHWGGALSDAEGLALYNAINTYKTAIGA